jgi:protein required for attachment to host cells
MKKAIVAKGYWVVVCDGKKALILENIGDEKFLNLHVKEVQEHADAPTHLQGASPPGRLFRSVGHGRSAVVQTDWHDEAERNFLTKLAGRLNTAVETGDVRAMTLIAPPRALGMIRAAYTSALRDAIVCEIPKDLVKQPTVEIERAVLQGKSG